MDLSLWVHPKALIQRTLNFWDGRGLQDHSPHLLSLQMTKSEAQRRKVTCPSLPIWVKLELISWSGALSADPYMNTAFLVLRLFSSPCPTAAGAITATPSSLSTHCPACSIRCGGTSLRMLPQFLGIPPRTGPKLPQRCLFANVPCVVFLLLPASLPHYLPRAS